MHPFCTNKLVKLCLLNKIPETSMIPSTIYNYLTWIIFLIYYEVEQLKKDASPILDNDMQFLINNL